MKAAWSGVSMGIVLLVAAFSTETHAQTLELTCGGTSVRLVCEDHVDEKTRCDVSHVEFVLPSGKVKTVRSLMPKVSGIMPDMVECLKSPRQYYILISASNGFNGLGSSYEDLYTLQGKALTQKSFWLDKTIKRLGIGQHIESYVVFPSNPPLPPQLN
jgi:hypothetical protein